MQGVVHDGFHSIVAGGCTQEEAYEAVAAPLLQRLRQGYSCTLIAYGQTGSGKTHTIFGPPGTLTEASLLHDDLEDEEQVTSGVASAPSEWGLFPRIALELLASGQATLHASAVEVYQEKAFDLLADRVQLSVGTQKVGRKVSGPAAKVKGNDATHKSTCTCRECYLAKEAELKARKERLAAPRSAKPAAQSFAELSGARGGGNASGGATETSFATVGESRMLISSRLDVARLSRTIELTRTAVGHLLNDRSSRSHCLVHLHVTERVGSAARGGDASAVALSERKLLFVDLAGSERILKSGAEGVAAAQAVAINTSLTALGKCVRAIAARAAYVPYRDSTLTQLLRSSLSGHACTAVVVTVASDGVHADETKCSLEYGQRMGAVKTRATVVATTSAVDEEGDVRRALAAARPALAEMEASGYGERFGKAAMPTEIRTFRETAHRLAELEPLVAQDKAALAELGATDRGGAAARALRSRLRESLAEMTNVKALLEQQKSIAGFWIAPRTVYTRKLAEVRALEGRLQQLSEATQLG